MRSLMYNQFHSWLNYRLQKNATVRNHGIWGYATKNMGFGQSKAWRPGARFPQFPELGWLLKGHVLVRTVTEEELPRTLSVGSPCFTWELLLSQGFPGWPPPLRCCSCICAWPCTSLVPTLTCRLDFVAWPCTCLAAVDVLGDHQAVADPGQTLTWITRCASLSCCALAVPWRKAEKEYTISEKKFPFIA